MVDNILKDVIIINVMCCYKHLEIEMTNRYRVNGRDMDGITGWFVVDTQHPYYKAYPTDYASLHCYGLSTNQQEMIELAEKMNQQFNVDEKVE